MEGSHHSCPATSYIVTHHELTLNFMDMDEIIESTNDEELPKLFLHVKFEVPSVVVESSCAIEERSDEKDGFDDEMLDDHDKNTKDTGLGCTESSTVTITKQLFDASNCNPAIIGLPHGIEPTKPEPGDYSYSGMHDHGPLPAPKEGGQFAQIIGLVSAAKKASDVYLTELIEREKILATSVGADSAQGGNPKRKRDHDNKQ